MRTDCLVQLHRRVHPHQLTFPPVLTNNPHHQLTFLYLYKHAAASSLTYLCISTALRSGILISFLISTDTKVYHHQQLTFLPVQSFTSHRQLTFLATHTVCSLTHASTCSLASCILINFLIQLYCGISSSTIGSSSRLEVSSRSRKSISQLKRTEQK